MTLVEVFPADRPVEDAIRSSVPLLQTITTETSYLYGITEAALIPGQTYAFRVRALDAEGRAMYKNEGYSQTCQFTYGDGVALAPPEGIHVYADNARRATVNWHLSLEPDRYRVEYRRRGDEGEEDERKGNGQDAEGFAWFSEETSEEQVVLRDLEPATTYEVRVASLFGGYVSRYSAMQTFTTPKVMVAACGAAPAPVISASTLPLTTALAGQYWQVGNFEMQVRDVRGGDGVYTGWGVMSVPYLGLQIPVKFDRVWVDEDYQVARGEVVALSEGIEGFRERWQEEHPQGEEAGEEKSSQEDEPVAEGSNENGASPDAPVASVVVAGEVREVYLNEQGQVVAVDSQGNEEVVAEEVPEEGEVLALEDSEGNSFTVGSDGGVSNGGASANGSDASAAAHALEKRLLAELLQDFDQKIVVWLENHEKGPLDEQTIRLLQELPSCVPPGSEEVVEIHQFIERLEDNLEEAWNSLSQATQQWFSEVVESLSPEQNSLAEQLSEEDQQAGEQIVCEMVVVNNDDFVLELLLGENTLQEAGVTMLVSAAPQMPDIRARVTKAGDSDVEVEMRLRIEYARSCPDAASRSRNDITYFPATGWHKINTNELWDIDFGHDNSVGIQRPMIRGGRATLMFKYGEEQEGSIEFMIKGENPTVQQVMSVLEQAPYNTIWFMKKVALHESATNNPTDNTARAQQFNYENDCCEGLDEDWDAWSRCPNQGAPCGWGLMQMDLPAPTIQAMWDWRANIHQAYNLLIGEKRQSVISHMRRSMNTINEWNFQHADNPVQGHADRDEGGIIYTHSSSDQFQNTGITNFDDHFVDGPDGDDRSFLDACWIKTYNGLGTERLHFYFVTQEGNNRPEWNISNTATYGNSVNYYVEDISEQNTP